MIAYRSLDLTSAVKYVQQIKNYYVKAKNNYDIYESIEVISEVLESTNQENSALNLENDEMIVGMKLIKKILEK